MAIIRSSIPRLLRAAAAPRPTTALLHPHPNLIRHHHSSFLPSHLFPSSLSRRVYTRATPLQPPYSPNNPFNLRVPKPNLLPTSISRRVHSRATALHKRPSPYSSIWPYAATLGCIATGMMVMIYYITPGRGEANILMSQQLKTSFDIVLPDMYHKGHSVVLGGFISPESSEDGVASQYYFTATEVLAKPREISAAIERNHKIIMEMLKAAHKDKLQVDRDAQMQGILELRILYMMFRSFISLYTMPNKAIIKDAADPSKSDSKGSVNHITLPSDLQLTITDSIDFILVRLQGLPDVLQRGHSVVVKGFVKPITDETEEDKLDEIEEVKSDEPVVDKSAKSVTVKIGVREYHFSAEVLAKQDGKYIPTDAAIEWNITESREKLWRSIAESCEGVAKSCG